MLPLNHEESHKQVCSEAIGPGGDDGVGVRRWSARRGKHYRVGLALGGVCNGMSWRGGGSLEDDQLPLEEGGGEGLSD